MKGNTFGHNYLSRNTPLHLATRSLIFCFFRRFQERSAHPPAWSRISLLALLSLQPSETHCDNYILPVTADKLLALRRYDCHYITMITSIFSRTLYGNELMNCQYGAKISALKRPASLFLRIAYASLLRSLRKCVV